MDEKMKMPMKSKEELMEMDKEKLVHMVLDMGKKMDQKEHSH